MGSGAWRVWRFGAALACVGPFGEWVRDGGEDGRESGAGCAVLREGCLRVLCAGGCELELLRWEGRGGEGDACAGLLLRGGAIVSLRSSGVCCRSTTEGIGLERADGEDRRGSSSASSEIWRGDESRVTSMGEILRFRGFSAEEAD